MRFFVSFVLVLAAAQALSVSAVESPTLRGLFVLDQPLSDGRCDANNRTDCGYYGINQAQCESRGCCWQPTTLERSPLAVDEEMVGGGPGGIPWCFFKSPDSPSCSTSPQCSGHGSCAAGSGACTCDSGYETCGPVSDHDCDVNVSNDPDNCGFCGHSCPSGTGVASRTCAASKCQITCSSGYIECFGQCVQASSCKDVAPFTQAEMNTMIGYFQQNIDVQGSGAVCASPSTSDPDYYYHWQRDGAISMRKLLSVKSITDAKQQIQDYVNWVRKVQFDSDPNGINVLGEPKFFMNGEVYNGGWMRPQNDGPALRSIVLIYYANQLLAAGQKDYVTSMLWNSDTSQPGINHDLNYIVANWNLPTGDPWEEVRGQVFFQKINSRRALIEGAALAQTLGDSQLAATYKGVAADIQSNIIDTHWNAQTGVIMEVPGIRELDSATHLGVTYGALNDGFLTPSSEKVQSSVGVLISSFQGYSDFSINAKDSAAGIPGLLVGRYLNDVYNGGNPSQPSGGNPWILCTSGLAEIFYRAASEHVEQGVVKVTELNQQFFKHAVALSAFGRTTAEDVDDDTLLAAIVPGNTISAADLTQRDLFRGMMRALTLTGDGILLRVRHHIEGQQFHCTEQINKDNGNPQGAHDLTWSYGTIIGAMNARAAAAETMQQL